jgi:predicted permease
MLRIPRLLRRLRACFLRGALEESMDAEMRHHLECEVRDRITGGMSPDEARRTARRDFGGVERFKEEARDQRGFRLLEELAADSRHALRVLRRHRAYTIAAVLTCALGIGLTTAIFGVVHGVLLSPLPYEDPDQLAVVWERHPARGVEENVVSVPHFEAWRERSRSFSAMAAVVPAPVTLGDGDPERLMGADVSPEYFPLLGVFPALGRAFTPEEADGRFVILGDALWRRRFGGDSSIVGRAILIDRRPFTVVGVMPADFDPPKFGWLPHHELWFPFAPTPDNRTWGRFLLVIGRLGDGISLGAARRDMEEVMARLVQEDSSLEGWSATVVGLAEQITGDVRAPLLVLMGAVALLLMMAATNVGSLTLGFLRRQEPQLALRRAVGATTGRIFRQLLTHSLVLGAIGSAAGCVTAAWGTALLRSLLPPGLPRGASIEMDRTVLLFALGTGMLATLSFGLVSALRGLSGDVRALATARIASQRASQRRGRGSAALVVAEIALGVIVAVSAGLMVRSFMKLRGVELGFDARSVVTARVSLPGAIYDTPERQRAFFDAWVERVRAMPGVRAAGLTNARPYACCAPVTTVSRPGEARLAQVSSVDIRSADSAFFSVLRIPLVTGAGLASHEPQEGPPRVVVNEILARTLWPGTNPVGRELHVVLSGGFTAQVVGVAGDVHLADSRTPPRATVYLPTSRFPSSVRDIVVRGDASGESLLTALRTTLRAMDPALPLYDATSLVDAVNASLAQDRFTTLILSVFAVVSLLLAAVGIYGVFAAEVTVRHQEIGVRLALGARPGGVLALVLRRALALALGGALLGVGLGLALARGMSRLVFQVETSDPLSFLAVAALLLVVALIATLAPALRAARIPPVEVMRSE